MFEKRGIFSIPKSAASEEKLTELALESGADDVRDDDDAFEIACDPAVFEDVRRKLHEAGIQPASAEISMVPSSSVTLTGDEAARMIKLIEALEEHDDVQNVYSNFEIPADEMEKLMA
jgi:transcriptional/translational regulatory protein YebC/TACO1